MVDGTPCCVHVGPDGAGHYVKMVHNGIEYADIQLIAEAYDLLTHVAGLDAPAIGKIFEEWNSGDLESFLIEITGKVLAKTDEKTGKPLVDVIVDQAEQKGTGTWTAVDALGLGVPLTGITEAVFARGLSALRSERKAASTTLAGPNPSAAENRTDLVDDIRQALYASKVVAYAQGFAQMRAASQANDWNLDLGAMATIWRGGCIIRAQFLNRIRDAYTEHGDVENLLMVPVLHRGGGRRAGRLAPGGDHRDRAGGAHPGVRQLAELLRRLPPRARPGQPDPGAARLLRRAHLPPDRRRGQLPHPVVAGRHGGAHRRLSPATAAGRRSIRAGNGRWW